jgi:uncharacterized protein (DUF1800 family)
MLRTLSIVLLLSFAAQAQTLTDRAAGRFLDQATWGPTSASITSLETIGIDAWLKNQYTLNVSDIPDQPILDSAGKNNNDLGPVQQAFFANTVNNDDQVRQRVAFALSQMWVVSTEAVTSAYAYPPYWRIFRDNAFKNYRDIIIAVTLNPAMGRYLSMANNNKANPAKGTAANENYARELMQLFTIGLNQLNMDGSPVLDSNGNTVPTYTQAIVTSTAKALTGWTYPVAPGAKAATNNPAYYIGQMYAVEAEHDTTSKQIIGGATIPAGQTAEQDLNTLVDALMAQPTMAPFVSKQLIQHLVTSNPSPAYIKRVATVFEKNSAGVRGDMPSVITAILTDPEARAGDSQPAVANFGHLREPVLWVANVLRGLNATVTTNNSAGGTASALGEPLFQEASVFSYFSPDNSIGPNLLGPEFQIYSTQTASYRANYIYGAAYGGTLAGSKLNLANFTAKYSASDLTALLDQIDLVFTHSSMSSTLRSNAMNAAKAAPTPAHAVAAALYVVLTSGEYLVIQ